MGCGHGPSAACMLSKLVQLPTPPLSKHQLKRLEEHKYQSAGRSLLEPLMQGYWEWLVGRVPAWIAPNLITIIGLLINVFTTLLLVCYCPTATEQVSCRLLTLFVLVAVTGFGWVVALGRAGSCCSARSPRPCNLLSVNVCASLGCWHAERARVNAGVRHTCVE